MSFHCRKKLSARVLQLSLSFAILVHTVLCCPTMSFVQRRFGLPTDLTPFICHSVLLITHSGDVSSPFPFTLVRYWTMSVTLVLCLRTLLPILSCSLTFSTFLSMAHWLVSSFFTKSMGFLRRLADFRRFRGPTGHF